MPDDVSIHLLQRYQQGDTGAANDLFDRYVHRLVGLARKRLSGKLARRVDAEDVVQSAYRSFFRGADEGNFEIRESGDLWRLLAAITLNKLRRQARWHQADKRSMRREDSIVEEGCARGMSPEKLAGEPLPDEAAAMTDQIELIMRDLEPLQRTMLELRLQGHTIEEIAEQVGRSERTVRRLLDRLKVRFEEELNSGSDKPPA